MNAILPIPPSANRYWRKFRNRIVVSEEARQYKKTVALHILSLYGKRDPAQFDVSVELTIYRAQKRGDLDNRQKILLDALQGIAFKNDSQVKELHSFLRDDKTHPRAVVRVYRLDPWKPLWAARRDCIGCDDPTCRCGGILEATCAL